MKSDLPSELLIEAAGAVGDLLAGSGIDIVAGLLGEETEGCGGEEAPMVSRV
jgi:hypothetical protein